MRISFDTEERVPGEMLDSVDLSVATGAEGAIAGVSKPLEHLFVDALDSSMKSWPAAIASGRRIRSVRI